MNEENYDMFNYNLSDMEPGRCFWDDSNFRVTTYYRFIQRNQYIGDYLVDMIEIRRDNITIKRDTTTHRLLEMKEITPEEFQRLEDAAKTLIDTVELTSIDVQKQAKQRHYRLIKKKPKE